MENKEIILADAHCHLYPPFFKRKEVPEAIERAKTKNVKIIVNSILNSNQFNFGAELTSYPGVYLTIGIQPTEIEAEKVEKVKEFLVEKGEFVSAVGEIGLDYYWVKEEEKQQKQRFFFKKVIEIALEFNKPIVIHSRSAETDAIDILETYKLDKVLMHCFTGNEQEIKRVVENGWFITVPTSLVYRKNFQRIVSLIPVEQLMLETDSPYHSLEKGKNNEPAAIAISAKKAAEIKEIKLEELGEKTTKNVQEFYKI